VVIEQDAASHRGIDDIRALQEAIGVAPVEGLIRVVILDEVHMLSNDAFNALLKVLEEPPSRVVFILATTELHKVPATIQSRCQIIRFTAAAPESVTQVLEKVIAAEKVAITDQQKQRIVRASNGSFRDAIKLLEQVTADKQVTDERLDLVTGDQQRLEMLLKALGKRQTSVVATFFRELRDQGATWSIWQQNLLNALHERLQKSIQTSESVTTQRAIVRLLEYLLQHLNGPEAVDRFLQTLMQGIQKILLPNRPRGSLVSEFAKKCRYNGGLSLSQSLEEHLQPLLITRNQIKPFIGHLLIGRHLFQQFDGVAETAVTGPHDTLFLLIGDSHFLGCDHFFQNLSYGFWRRGCEADNLTTGLNSGRHLMQLRRGENKDDSTRRLLEHLE
jgi:DNA polymerase-3 subunit gamma/tau